MENFSYHVPFYVVTGGISASGHSSDLKAGQIGIYDRSTFSVATSLGSGKEFFFAQGAIGGKDWYGQPVTESHKSPFFFGKDVENMYLSKPQTIQNEEWVIGFNGAASSTSLSFQEEKAVRIQFLFSGQPIYRFFGGPKTYVVSYTPPKDCSAPCAEGDCPDPIVDCLVHSQALVNAINEHTELQKFGVRASLVNTPFSATSTNMTNWELEVCDNGDVQALQAVQAQYSAKIVRKSRVGSTSTYIFCQADTEDDPADFEQSGAILAAVCGECPAGTTFVGEKDVYFVSRPLAGSEDLNDGTARQTYADVIGSAYGVRTFNGASGVDDTTEVITITSHGWITGTPVVYQDGGGTSISPLVDGTTYYVIKTGVNTIKLATTRANALAGTAINLTDGVGASHTLTAVVTAKFIQNNGATALVKVTVPGDMSMDPLLADTVEFSHTEAAQCQFADPSDIAWTEGDAGIRSKRTMKIKALQRPECDSTADRLDDLESILSGVEGIDISSLAKIAGTGCADDYTVEQWSVDCFTEDECLTNNVTFTYDELPAFESKSWELVPEDVEEDEDRKCGIRVSAGYIDPKFGNCSFDPIDYYENQPVKMEVSLLVEDASACDFASLPSVQQTKVARIARQSGEWVVREVIMKTDAYQKHVDQYSNNSRMREAFDMNLLGMVDRNAFYNLYYVTYKASYGNSYRKNEQESFTTIFAFKEGDANEATFKSQVLDVLTAKSGVTMHVNS